jgi:transposase
MRKKGLSNEDVVQIVKQLNEGKDAKKLANAYNVSVATIYNFRTRLKRSGTVVSSDKGGRKPKEIIAELSSAPNKRGRKPKSLQVKIENKKGEAPVQKVTTSVKMEQYNSIINGVKVTISGKAKNVHIAANAMFVNF